MADQSSSGGFLDNLGNTFISGLDRYVQTALPLKDPAQQYTAPATGGPTVHNNTQTPISTGGISMSPWMIAAAVGGVLLVVLLVVRR